MPLFSGKEGQARMQPHAHTHAHSNTHTHTHTHTPLPALVLGEGQNNLLNKDSAGKLPSVSSGPFPRHG